MNNITIKKYKSLVDVIEYETVLKHIAPLNDFNGVVFNENTVKYKEVRAIIKLIRTGTTWESLYKVFKIMYDCTIEEFNYSTIVDFYKCRNYIIEYIAKTQKREARLLQSIGVDAELWQQAGGDRLNVFSDLTPLNQLAKIYGGDPYEWSEKPYKQLLTLLVLNKTDAEVTTNFNKLKSKI